MKNKPVIVKKQKPAQKPPVKSPAIPTGSRNVYYIVGCSVTIFLISLITYLPMTQNDFIRTWDDGIYVVDNVLLHDLSAQNIVNIFRYGDDFQKLINNYHPVTILSLALNYNSTGLSPAGFHITNMVLHSINGILVFLFVFLLSRRRLWPAIISGFLFAVHPMHVESVAWVSERKDVLYTLFFLAGLIAYLKYLGEEKYWQLGLAFVFFLLSCLSKAMAVPFPVILLLIDYFRRRKLTWKLILEKIPFFMLALIIGMMSVHLQSISAINKFETFTIYQRIMHAAYGFVTYLKDFFFPSGLSAFYPYPAITSSGLLPLPFRAAPYVVLAFAAVITWLATRKDDISRVIVFGILFYTFTLILVLQFLSVGKAIMADRYTYIPYIGIGFIVSMIVDWLIQQKSSLKYTGYILIALIAISGTIFAFVTHDRTSVWKDDITLWSDAIQKYPDGRLNFIYEKRAERYLLTDQFESAMADYLTISANDPRNENALEAIGRIYGKYYHDMGKAVENLEKAYAVNPRNPSVLKSLGVAMGIQGNFKKSLDYLLQAYEVDKSDTTLLRNISSSYFNLGMTDKGNEYQQLFIALKGKMNSGKSL